MYRGLRLHTGIDLHRLMARTDLVTEIERSALVRERRHSIPTLIRGWRVDLFNSVLTDRDFGELLAQEMVKSVQDAGLPFDAVCPVPRSGLPLGAAFERACQYEGIDLTSETLARGAATEYPGLRVLIVDDTVNTGLTSRLTARRIRRVGAIPVGICSVLQYRSTILFGNPSIPVISLVRGAEIR